MDSAFLKNFIFSTFTTYIISFSEEVEILSTSPVSKYEEEISRGTSWNFFRLKPGHPLYIQRNWYKRRQLLNRILISSSLNLSKLFKNFFKAFALLKNASTYSSALSHWIQVKQYYFNDFWILDSLLRNKE